MHKEDSCPLCPTIPGQEKSRDRQEHLLVCKMLQCDNEIGQAGQSYNDIYSDNVQMQANVTLLLENKYKRGNKKKKQIVRTTNRFCHQVNQ